ncbi:hypothetical protein DFH08DRAFT_716790 [Mycena albidolilacea]|uniref:Uncharacterized protein n=1 Tax=Mycena albidolilacea TaxID=1033008 RepID=A0AAD6ZAR4_9AGAR|nr:hypothetical protein DFH08DRAFT_716790 [Mycena albidolilacea]
MTCSLNEFPRWPGLIYVSAATVINYSEGQIQSTLIIHFPQCIIPCLVHLLPRNSAIIKALRALQQFQTFMGMHCLTTNRLEVMKTVIHSYEMACRGVKDKDFNFLKQHITCHAPDDIRQKGTSNHATTRTDEGFQQEVARHYARTNRVNPESQMVHIDETEEAMARLDMIVADCMKATHPDKSADNKDKTLDADWHFGALNPVQSSQRFEADMSSIDPAYAGFDLALREYLARIHPALQIAYEDTLQIHSFCYLRVPYQLRVNWYPERDILRCSPEFHGRPRYDLVLFNADDDPLALAHLISLLRVETNHGIRFDLTFVYRFKNSKWKPRTFWDGCHVMECSKKPQFLPLDCVARGALLARAYGTQHNDLFFVVDTVDGDMYLRLNNIA